MISYIYRYRNKVDGKVYIGQTVHPEVRKREHLYDAEHGSNLAFHRAIRKYGIDNFDYDILHTVEGEEKYVRLRLNELECKEIISHNAYESGYNLTHGGYDMSAVHRANFKVDYPHNCVVCGKNYTTKKPYSRFCSGACEQKWRRASGVNNIEKPCAWCGNIMLTDKYAQGAFCSIYCSNKWNYKTNPHMGNRGLRGQ